MAIFFRIYTRVSRAFRFAFLLSQVDDLRSKSSYEEALAKLCELELIHSNVEIRIRKSFLLFSTKNFRESICLCLLLLDEIECDENISPDDKVYLNEFVLSVWEDASEFDDEFLPPHRNLDSVNLDLVHKRIKRLFPLREHRDWSIKGTD